MLGWTPTGSTSPHRRPPRASSPSSYRYVPLLRSTSVLTVDSAKVTAFAAAAYNTTRTAAVASAAAATTFYAASNRTTTTTTTTTTSPTTSTTAAGETSSKGLRRSFEVAAAAAGQINNRSERFDHCCAKDVEDEACSRPVSRSSSSLKAKPRSTSQRLVAPSAGTSIAATTAGAPGFVLPHRRQQQQQQQRRRLVLLQLLLLVTTPTAFVSSAAAAAAATTTSPQLEPLPSASATTTMRGGSGGSRGGSNVYKIGYIPQFTGNMGGSKLGLKISGALSYAAQKINESSTILGNDTVDILFEDEGGDPVTATRLVVEMYNKNVSVIIGPENFCKTEASVATAVDLPIFSYKCNDPNIHILETNMISLVPTEKYVVDMLFALLRWFNWSKFTLIFEETETRPLRTKLRNRVEAEGATFKMNEAHYVRPGNARCVTASPNRPECDYHYLSELIQRTKDDTRIYVFMGDVTNLSRFVFGLAAMGLTKHGEYKVIYITTDHSLIERGFNDEYRQFSSSTDWARYGYNMGAEHTLAILPRRPRGAIKDEEFETVVTNYNKEAPFRLRSPSSFGAKYISIYAYYLYDALITWANAVTELRAAGREDWTKGKVVAGHIRNMSAIPSLTGINLLLEKDGTVVGEYELLSFTKPLSPESEMGYFDVIGSFQVKSGKVYLNMSASPFDVDVLDEPSCGFDGQLCPSDTNLVRKWVAGTLGAILCIVALVTTFIYRNWQYEQEIAGLLWMIDRHDLAKCHDTAISAVSKMSLASTNSGTSLHLSGSLDVCNYRGALVVIKKLQMARRGVGDIPRRLKKEIKFMRELHHHNVNPFIGAFVSEPTEIVVCTEYCSKGSLQEILEDDDVKLDNMFIASLVMDLVKGIEYIHQSSIRMHGNLKSTNCLITNKWTLQLSDFGLSELRCATEQCIRRQDDIRFYRSLLWRSPQQLRACVKGLYMPPTQKDDVYSFAIILHEIMTRQGAWGNYNMEAKEIISKLCAIPVTEKDAFRPSMEDLQCQDYVVKVITDSWAENPADRPEITEVAVRLKRMRGGMKANIVDNMVAMLEKYASNLESLVSERTRLLEEEKKKTETLLHRMLPKSVASQLMRGEYVVPETFDAVTIYFSDIVGFTELSSSSTPMEVVNLLNDLYTLFDSIIRNYNVYKVETIGDAYMVVSGLPERNGDQHASEISLMALELLDAVKTFHIRHRPTQQLKLRIGLHTGPVVAGVVGLTMPRYCLFGDTVNTASRMESNGEALRIHVSLQTKDVLDSIGGFVLERRGHVKMKGKGEQLTYWLEGHRDGPLQRREPFSVPLTPLFNGPQGELIGSIGVRRRSLLPRVDSADAGCGGVMVVASSSTPATAAGSLPLSLSPPPSLAPLLPNGGAGGGGAAAATRGSSIITHHSSSSLQKRPSQAKLQQSKLTGNASNLIANRHTPAPVTTTPTRAAASRDLDLQLSNDDWPADYDHDEETQLNGGGISFRAKEPLLIATPAPPVANNGSAATSGHNAASRVVVPQGATQGSSSCLLARRNGAKHPSPLKTAIVDESSRPLLQQRTPSPCDLMDVPEHVAAWPTSPSVDEIESIAADSAATASGNEIHSSSDCCRRRDGRRDSLTRRWRSFDDELGSKTCNSSCSSSADCGASRSSNADCSGTNSLVGADHIGMTTSSSLTATPTVAAAAAGDCQMPAPASIGPGRTDATTEDTHRPTTARLKNAVYEILNLNNNNNNSNNNNNNNSAHRDRESIV